MMFHLCNYQSHFIEPQANNYLEINTIVNSLGYKVMRKTFDSEERKIFL